MRRTLLYAAVTKDAAQQGPRKIDNFFGAERGIWTFYETVSQISQTFRLIVRVQRFDEFIHCTFKYVIELVKGQAYPVIGHPVLGIIICPDALTPVSASHLGLSVCGTVLVLFLYFQFKKSRTKDL